MSWTKVAETNNGYKKYRDNHGNARYIGPNGFTNSSSYNGNLGNVNREIEHKENEANSKDESKVTKTWLDTGGTIPPRDEWIRTDVTEKYKYEKAVNYEIKLNPPVSIKEIGAQYWIQKLQRKSDELTNYEAIYWQIFFKVKGESPLSGESNRNTERVLLEDRILLSGKMKTIIAELSTLADSYSDVEITKFRINVRDYQ